jgi:hypothetical protein
LVNAPTIISGMDTGVMRLLCNSTQRRLFLDPASGKWLERAKQR